MRQRIVVDGKLAHSELVLEEGVIMIGTANGPEPWQQLQKSPRNVGGVTHALVFYIDDVDAHHAKAVLAGAEILEHTRRGPDPATLPRNGVPSEPRVEQHWQ